METIHSLEIPIILFIQNLGEWLRYPMRTLTLLGDREFYLLIAPVLYWCIDPVVGIRFGLYFMFSGSMNFLFKYLLHTPRPFWIDTRVIPEIIEMNFGMPSGHAQNAVVVFGSLTHEGKIRLGWVWVGILALFIGLSRIYLGVHFISDVLVGWLVGGIILWLAIRWEKPFVSWFSKQTYLVKYLVVLGTSLGVLLIGLIFYFINQNQTLPVVWAENISMTTGLEIFESPYNLANLFSYCGAFLGLAGGAVWLNNRGGFTVQASIARLALRYVLGLAVILAIYIGLDILFPDGESLVAHIFRYARYALIGSWVSAIGPYIFIKFRL
jgi:membrane-associated phospholipid phosphatase